MMGIFLSVILLFKSSCVFGREISFSSESDNEVLPRRLMKKDRPTVRDIRRTRAPQGAPVLPPFQAPLDMLGSRESEPKYLSLRLNNLTHLSSEIAVAGTGSTREYTASAYTRMFVEYFDEEGKQEILTSSRVIKKYEDQNLLVVEVDEDTKIRLASRRIIKAMQFDGRVEASGSFQQFHSGERSLKEEIPWGIRMVQADQLEVGSSPVKACIIDTGYALGHPDLPQNVTGDDAINKYNEIYKWRIDFNGHGSHLAGTIAALGKNNIGVVGIGAIPLHITRGLDDNSGGFESDILDALDQCVASGSKVINLSLGGNTMSERSRLKYEKIVNVDGVMIVSAAGNLGIDKDQFPASHPDVISVTAVYEWARYWEGSNYGPQVELAAPGFAILSTSTTLTAVHTWDYSFTATQVGGSRTRERTSILFDCGSGGSTCMKPIGFVGGICLMSQDLISVQAMVRNCISNGGVGAIIFFANGQQSNLSAQARVDIPVVIVTKKDGMILMSNYLGRRISIGFHKSDSPEYTYAYMQGTSMAVPHVVGVAALVWSHFPTCTNQEIRYALAVTAEDQGMPGCDWDYGHGIVKARAAYDWLTRNPCGSGNVGRKGGGCLLTT